MQETVLSTVVLPVAVFVVMVLMGMTLSVADFRRLLVAPRPILVGLVCQVLLLPALAFGCAFAFRLDPLYAVSLILIAAAPGGATSNLIVHAVDADRALSVSLTAISNGLAWVTMPLGLGLAYRVFGLGGTSVDVPIAETMLQVAILSVVPVAIGIGIRAWRPAFADRSRQAGKVIAMAFLLVVVAGLVIQNWTVLVTDGPKFAASFVTLNLVGLLVGYGLSRLVALGRPQALTIAVETGIQNSALAITVAITVLGIPEMAVIPGLYGIWMIITGFAFAFWMSRGRRDRPRFADAATQQAG